MNKLLRKSLKEKVCVYDSARNYLIISQTLSMMIILKLAIGNHLTWEVHINSLTTKISKGEGIRLRLSKK